MLLAIDEEGGDVTRLEWRDGQLVPRRRGARRRRRRRADRGRSPRRSRADLAAVGVNWNFAPVADVNVPANPVIGVRAFGADAALVAPHVAAFVRGLQRSRVAACAKHFPGHGATEQDSHLELPVVTGDLDGGARAVPRGDRGRRAVRS